MLYRYFKLIKLLILKALQMNWTFWQDIGLLLLRSFKLYWRAGILYSSQTEGILYSYYGGDSWHIEKVATKYYFELDLYCKYTCESDKKGQHTGPIIPFILPEIRLMHQHLCHNLQNFKWNTKIILYTLVH